MVSHRPHCYCCCCCCNHLFLPQALPYVILLIAMLFFIYAIIGMQVGKPRKLWERNKLQILSWNCPGFRRKFLFRFSGTLSSTPTQTTTATSTSKPFTRAFLSYSGKYSYFCLIQAKYLLSHSSPANICSNQTILFHFHFHKVSSLSLSHFSVVKLTLG